MKLNLGTIRIKATGRDLHNIRLAVYPFRQDSIYMLEYRGDYGHSWQEPLSPWKVALADTLWDSIPGLQRIFYSNGEISLQHSGAFEDAEVKDLAVSIISPALEQELRLQMMD